MIGIVQPVAQTVRKLLGILAARQMANGVMHSMMGHISSILVCFGNIVIRHGDIGGNFV